MITWNNLDTLTSYQELEKAARVNLAEAMTGEKGAERVKKYSVPMAEGLVYHYAAKQVDDTVLDALQNLADEAQLSEKFKALYNGEVINTGEKRLVLHHMTRGQLGDAVIADGVDKRTFYKQQQERIAEFANKVHNGDITNAAGEKFTTVVQIGIGGSDLGPRALENWAKKNGTFKMEAKFISNVDPDDAAAVLYGIDVAHSIFVLVSKSGTTLETLTNESFVKDALKKAGLDRRTLFFYFRSGRRCTLPCIWPGGVCTVSRWRGRGRQAGSRSRCNKECCYVRCPDRCLRAQCAWLSVYCSASVFSGIKPFSGTSSAA